VLIIGEAPLYFYASSEHQKVLNRAIKDGSGVFPNTQSFIKATLAQLHTDGRRSSTGAPLLVQDGDKAIEDALSGSHPCALIHVTDVDVGFEDLEPLPRMKASLSWEH
jgi:hypothetical protein